MASSTSSITRAAYPVGPKAKVYLEKKVEEISARGDGLITDLDIWEAWKATKIPKMTLRSWLETQMFSHENTPSPYALPLVIRHPSLLPLAPHTSPVPQQLSSSACTPTAYGRPTSVRAILHSINEESECRNAGTTLTLAHYLNNDDGGSGGVPIVSQQHSNEGVQMTGSGTPVADAVLELTIAIQVLGVMGQADLIRWLYKGTAKNFVRKKGDKQLIPFKPDSSLSLAAQLDVWKKQRDAMQSLSAENLAARK